MHFPIPSKTTLLSFVYISDIIISIRSLNSRITIVIFIIHHFTTHIRLLGIGYCFSCLNCDCTNIGMFIEIGSTSISKRLSKFIVGNRSRIFIESISIKVQFSENREIDIINTDGLKITNNLILQASKFNSIKRRRIFH